MKSFISSLHYKKKKNCKSKNVNIEIMKLNNFGLANIIYYIIYQYRLELKL